MTDFVQGLPAEKSKSGVPVLELRGITKVFPGVRALDNVSFSVQGGEVHALCGENGAGKSTLLKILCGAYRPDGGELYLKGAPVAFRHPKDAQKAGISIIYQEFNLLPDRTVAQNIFLGREPMRGLVVDQARMNRETTALLQQLEFEIPPYAMISKLRVAQQQVVEIAKALSLNADILLMDEPTASLAPAEVNALLSLVERLQQRGVTVIYISHRLDEVKRIADSVTVLKDGAHVATRPASEVSPTQLVALMVGRELTHYYPPLAAPDEVGKPIFEVRDLYVSNWLKAINLEVRRGEILGIAGLEGSGRTFLARSLFGAERISRGKVRLHGQKLTLRSPVDAIRAGIGFISEDRKREGLVLISSIRRNTALPSLDLRQFLSLIQFRKEKTVVRDLGKSMELRAAGEHVETQYLSGGNQQKVVLAKWLATNAKLLIFDEPTRGIDVGAKAGIHALMRDLARQGIGIIMISSELPEVIGMSDRIMVMRRGELTAEFRPDKDNPITEQAIMAAATGTRPSEAEIKQPTLHAAQAVNS